MKDDWILAVLRDLLSFARKNELPALAQQLETTVHVASCELVTGQSDDGQTAGRLPKPIGRA